MSKFFDWIKFSFRVAVYRNPLARMARMFQVQFQNNTSPSEAVVFASNISTTPLIGAAGVPADVTSSQTSTLPHRYQLTTKPSCLPGTVLSSRLSHHISV